MRKKDLICYLILCIILFFVISFKLNTSGFYNSLGNFFYKTNNYKNAQVFYGKSIKFGNTNTATRNIFVNILINLEPTTEIQEKLANIAEDHIQDEASIAAKSYLTKIKNNIKINYPNTYIKQATSNGMVIRWNELPITYSFVDNNIDNDILHSIRDAFSEWEKVGNIYFEENSQKPNIRIHFINNSMIHDLKNGEKYVIAYTLPQITSNKLEEMNIYFNLNDIEGNKFSPKQIYNTALHEIFHSLGFMGHSSNPDDIMFMSKAPSSFFNTEKERLSIYDIQTFNLLYEIKPDITNNHKNISKYIPYLVIGNDEEIISSKITEARDYIRKAPTLPSGYIDLADTYVSQNDYNSAISALNKALELARTSNVEYLIYYNLSICYSRIDDFENAIYYIDNAIQIQNSEEAHFLKAEILYKFDIKEAEREYEYLVNVNNQNIIYSLRLANAYIKQHKYLKARKVLKNFIKNNPEEENNEKLSPYRILLF